MQQDWAATKEHLYGDIRCPSCMDEEMLSNVTVYWVSHGKGGSVLRCACDRGHEFEEVIESDFTDGN